MTGSGLEVIALGGYIGAEIRGLDLRDNLSDRAVESIREAVCRHHVVFFRDQDLTDDEQVAFAGRFGEVSVEPGVNADHRFQIVEDTAENPPHTNQWHTDMTCWEKPPAFAFLSARVIPPTGGDTVWVNLCAIVDALSPALRDFVETLHVRHHVGPRFRDAVAQTLAASTRGDRSRIRAELDMRYDDIEAIHPLVRTHPLTGQQALFLSPRFVHSIVELNPSESDALLAYLNTYLDDPNYQIRWRWHTNDLAVWDEATTNHRALADHFHPGPQHRLMRRCTVEGDAPFFRRLSHTV